MINSRRVEDLHPLVQTKAISFLELCANQLGPRDIEVRLTSTYRDGEAQSVEYAKGRTTNGPCVSTSNPLGLTVTKAKPGESFHNYRVAFDFAPFINGIPQWSRDDLFTECGHIAESVGLDWSGRWKQNKEKAHCQYTGGLTLSDFQRGKIL